VQAAAPTNGLAIASLVCGIIGLLGFCCCVSWIFPIPAIICGHMGLNRANRGSGGGRGMAIAGLIMGYLSVLLIAASVVSTALNPEFGKAMEEIQGELKKSFEEGMQQAKEAKGTND
jgi:hypothetical protein